MHDLLIPNWGAGRLLERHFRLPAHGPRAVVALVLRKLAGDGAEDRPLDRGDDQ